MQKQNKYQLIIISILSFSFGIIFIVVLKKYSHFLLSETISIEINPFDILGMSLTFFVAFYVTRKLTRDNEREKAEKELLISYFKDFRNELKETIDKILEENLFDTTYTKSKMKILRKTLLSNINLSLSHSFIDENSNTSKNLTEYLTDLWELTTDKPAQDKIEITKQDVMKKLIKIDEEIFKIILEINKK